MGRRREWPAVTAAQMREVDRAMIEDFRIELVQMMENAGAGLARLAVEAFAPSRVVVLTGHGGNGGGVNRPGIARGWGSGHLAPLGDGVSIHGFPFNWRHVIDRRVDSLVVVPAHPLGRLALDLPQSVPVPAARPLVDQLCLVETDSRLHERIVKRIADRADRPGDT